MTDTLLLVDDDKEFREEFKEGFAEYRIIEASSGPEALAILKKPNEIDAVILDVQLPGLSGTEVLKRMKTIIPDLGVVIVTAHGSKDVAVEALKGHADDYIEKPFDMEKTRAILESVLAARRRPPRGEKAGRDDKIARVRRFIERNAHKKVRLEDAAAAVCISPKYLSRIFREKTGMSFVDYKLKEKIERTKKLLRQTNDTVSQIADKMDYQNPESLIRTFRKITGYTPSGFRRKSEKHNRRARKKASAGRR